MQTNQRVALTGMFVSGALAVLKILTGLAGHSTAVVADGFESGADVFASGFVLLGLTLAAKPADREHPYGHGRFEILTGLALGIALTATGAVIAYRALHNLGGIRPPPQAFVVWPLLVSALAKAGLSALKFHYGKKSGSAALSVDAWNDCVDVVSALTALLAVGLALADPARFLVADEWGAFAVGFIVIFTGVRVTRETALYLMDTMPDDARIEEVRRVARDVPGARGVEKCYARKTGLQYHVDLHLEVDPEITVRASHEIAREVRNRIRSTLPWVADVLVHVEPSP